MEFKLITDNSLDRFVEEKMDYEAQIKNDYIKKHVDDTGIIKRKFYNYAVYEKNQIIAASLGWMRYEWFFLRDLWVDEKHRNMGIGSMLLNKIEQLAIKEKQIGIRLETWDFQAPKFYEKNGYELYGKIDDCPPGVSELFYKKVFKN